jgi:hypothetical protein
MAAGKKKRKGANEKIRNLFLKRRQSHSFPRFSLGILSNLGSRLFIIVYSRRITTSKHQNASLSLSIYMYIYISLYLSCADSHRIALPLMFQPRCCCSASAFASLRPRATPTPTTTTTPITATPTGTRSLRTSSTRRRRTRGETASTRTRSWRTTSWTCPRSTRAKNQVNPRLSFTLDVAHNARDPSRLYPVPHECGVTILRQRCLGSRENGTAGLTGLNCAS